MHGKEISRATSQLSLRIVIRYSRSRLGVLSDRF